MVKIIITEEYLKILLDRNFGNIGECENIIR